MACKIEGQAVCTIQASFTFDEEELRALNALVGYGVESFLQVFYEKLGKTYLRPHEQGLRNIFAAVTQSTGTILAKANRAKTAFNGVDPDEAFRITYPDVNEAYNSYQTLLALHKSEPKITPNN